jgi:hypothetical protein
VPCPDPSLAEPIYLHGASYAEDAVVGLLGLEALEGGLDNVVLLGEQVIGPVRQSASALHPRCRPIPSILSHATASEGAYLSPSCLYPALLQYQLASGVIQRCSHGRFLMKGASDGADMFSAAQRCGVRGCRGAGGRQWQGVVVVRTASSSGERLERQLGEASSGPPRNSVVFRHAASLRLPTNFPSCSSP